MRSFFNRHRSRPHLVHWKHPGPLLYELMKDPGSGEVNLWLQLLILRPQNRYEKPHWKVCLHVGVCVVWLLILSPSSWLRHAVQSQIKMTRTKMLPLRPFEMITRVHSSLQSTLSLFASALSTLNKSLIPKNTVSSLPAISLSLTHFPRLHLPLFPSLFSSTLVLFWTAALPLLCRALSLSLSGLSL